MAIRSYVEVVFDQRNNCVSFADRGRKPEKTSALSTLKSIESLMRQKVLGPKGVTREVLWADFKEKAESIQERYLAKTGQMGALRRWLFSIPRKEHAIRAVYARICNLPVPTSTGLFPALLELPKDPFQVVMSYLPVSDIGKVAQAYSGSTRNANKSIVRRAREYGYEGNDHIGAQSYLNSLFTAVKILIIDKIIPIGCIVLNEGSKEINVEASFRKIKQCSTKNPTRLKKGYFSKVLIYYDTDYRTVCIRPFIFKILLILGADPNACQSAIYNDIPKMPPLLTSMIVRFYVNRRYYEIGDTKECIRLLLENGANPNLAIPAALFEQPPLIEAVRFTENWNDINDIIELLCQKGADVNHIVIKDFNNSSLHYAVRNGNWEAVRILLKYDANPFVVDSRGQTPFQLMSWWSKIRLRRGLLTFPRMDEVRRSANGQRE